MSVKKNVYKCNNDTEIQEHVKKGHCIATKIKGERTMGVLIDDNEY